MMTFRATVLQPGEKFCTLQSGDLTFWRVDSGGHMEMAPGGPDDEARKGDVDWTLNIDNEDEFHRLADMIYDRLPYEGESYQAAAENVAMAMIKDGWGRQV